MTWPLELIVFSVFLVFCRVGGCVLFAPGLSSSRIPLQVRLLVTLGIVLALSPLLIDTITKDIASVSDLERPLLIIREVVTGLIIGVMGRLFLLGLQFAANAIWSTIGLAGIPGVSLEESEAGSPLATLASSAAVMTILSLGLHIEMLRAVIDSYSVIRILTPVEPERMLSNFTRVVVETSVLAIRLAAPFIAYGIVVNISLGLANRFIPHISLYHATTGLVMLMGLVLLHLLWPEWMIFFISAYSEWLQHGGF